ncbi:Bug family tripartite tricarboxylate transporter substrate binding protein [Ramlibacter sp.]|uniref:Bug family tripartite tricarboxylate transporter substrate binding protein n=1 Tax=Ramlibacter sp. TaxID=1917967 RepID=UPI003D136EE9
MNRITRVLLALAAAATSLAPLLASAQNFKAPIRVIVPYAPGGGTDQVARLLAPGLAKELGQNVVIENRPGASGQIGTQLVQNATPDGTTLLFTVDQSMIIVPLTTPGVNYNATADFVPLGQGARTFWTLMVPGTVAHKDMKDYVAALKRDPLLRSYGVPYVGGAPTVVGDALGKHAGVTMVPVPFQGSAPVLQNIMANQVPAGITGMPEAVQAHKSGKAKVIAVSGSRRTPLLPDVPTFKELGVEGLEFHTFIGYFAPKGLPPAMAQEFNAALRKSLADPAVVERISATAMTPAPTTLDEAMKEVGDIAKFWREALPPKR